MKVLDLQKPPQTPAAGRSDFCRRNGLGARIGQSRDVKIYALIAAVKIASVAAAPDGISSGCAL